jgi:hypothetical protein
LNSWARIPVDVGDDVRGQPERELGGVNDHAQAEALPETGSGEGQDRNGLFPLAAAVTRTLMS